MNDRNLRNSDPEVSLESQRPLKTALTNYQYISAPSNPFSIFFSVSIQDEMRQIGTDLVTLLLRQKRGFEAPVS